MAPSDLLGLYCVHSMRHSNEALIDTAGRVVLCTVQEKVRFIIMGRHGTCCTFETTGEQRNLRSSCA